VTSLVLDNVEIPVRVDTFAVQDWPAVLSFYPSYFRKVCQAGLVPRTFDEYALGVASTVLDVLPAALFCLDEHYGRKFYLDYSRKYRGYDREIKWMKG
jgi:hypothetical protein